MTTIQDAARYYIEQDWSVIRVPQGEKAPGKGWQNAEPEPKDFEDGDNIGLRPGPRSGGVVDIDLDIPEARMLAGLPQFFGDTIGWRRHSQSVVQAGHRLVRCPDAPDKAEKFEFRGKKELAALDGAKACILEMRGGGCQSVIPPSTLPRKDGKGMEQLHWVQGDLAEMDWEALQTLLGILAVLSVLAREYPTVSGGRDDYALHLAGALHDMGLAEESASEIVEAIARYKGDEEAHKRGRTVRVTYNRAADGTQVNGLHGMLEHADLLPLKKRLYTWLGRNVPSDGGDVEMPAGAFDILEVNDAFYRSRLEKFIHDRLPGRVFRQPGQLVRARTLTEAEFDRSIVVHPGSVEVAPVDKHWLAHELAAAGGRVFAKSAKGPVEVSASKINYEQLIKLPERASFPRLRGISRVPTVARDSPGYDERSEMLLVFEPNEFPNIPKSPSKTAAREALDRLLRPLRRFPFDGQDGQRGPSRSVALSALLSGVARSELDNIPLHAVSAPVAGTGKTKLLDVVGLVASGTKVAQVTFTQSPEEMEKRLAAMLLRGAAVVNLDNVSAPLGGDLLCSALTSDTVTIRPLGVSQTVDVDSRSLIVASGNNLVARGDLVRRMVQCRLIRPGVENPERLAFDFDPVEEARVSRGDLVAAALTVLRAYDVAGRPKSPGHVALGSFERWDDLVRGALLWLGEADPLDTQADLEAEDEEREELDWLLEELTRAFGSGEWFTVNDIGRHQSLRDAMAEQLFDGHWRPKKVGRLLRRYEQRMLNGRMLKMGDDAERNVKRYTVLADKKQERGKTADEVF